MRKLNDGPQETTRLLADTVRFARDTEALGMKYTFSLTIGNSLMTDFVGNYSGCYAGGI